jgi:hypothetical protein
LEAAARLLRLLEDGAKYGLAVFDDDLEVDLFPVLPAEAVARFEEALGDRLVGDGGGRLVLSTLGLDQLRIKLPQALLGKFTRRLGGLRRRE